MEKPSVRRRPVAPTDTPPPLPALPTPEELDALPMAAPSIPPPPPAAIDVSQYLPAIPPPPPPLYRPTERQAPPPSTQGYIRKRQMNVAENSLDKLAFFGEGESSDQPPHQPRAPADKRPRQDTVESVRAKLVRRLECEGLTAPAAAEAVKTPVIISNKIGRGITPDEAERAKAETVQKLMRWKYDKAVKAQKPH